MRSEPLDLGPDDVPLYPLLPGLHDAHVWDWMDNALQELIDAPIAQVVGRLDTVANAWRNPAPITWSDLVDEFACADPSVDAVAVYRAHHLCQPFEAPSDIPF